MVLPLVPDTIQPEQYIGINLRGVGVIIFLIFTVIVGWVAKGITGTFADCLFAERVVDRMPVVRSVYSGIKQISETVFAQTDRSFRKGLPYPVSAPWYLGHRLRVHHRQRRGFRPPCGDRRPNCSACLFRRPRTPHPGFLLFFPAEEDVILNWT